MSNSPSLTTYVMARELPWPHVAPAADAFGALDPAALVGSGEARPCAIRRLSMLGATVRGDGLRGEGETVGLELETG